MQTVQILSTFDHFHIFRIVITVCVETSLEVILHKSASFTLKLFNSWTTLTWNDQARESEVSKQAGSLLTFCFDSKGVNM